MGPYETLCSIELQVRGSKAPLSFRRRLPAWLWFSSWRVATSAQFTFGPKVNCAEDLTLPGGGQARIMVEAERSFDSRRGSGPLTIRFERDGVETEVARGDSIEFGNTRAKLVDLVRWSGFTYVRSPGMPAVFTGFTLVLAACVLLIFPSGVAHLDTCDGSEVARVWLTRGSAVMEVAWQRWRDESTEIATTGPVVPPSRGRKDSSWSHNQ